MRRHGDHQQGDRRERDVAGQQRPARSSAPRLHGRGHRRRGCRFRHLPRTPRSDSRVIARVNLVSWEGPSTAIPTATEHTSPESSAATPRREIRDDGIRGRQRAGVQADRRARARRDGVGYTSDVIAGIDWAVANRAKYGIRVINLSLGHAVSEPAAIDPLCQAVAARGAGGRRRRGVSRQLRCDVNRSAGARRHHVARQLAVCDHRRRHRHGRARSHARTTRSRPTVRRDRHDTTWRSSQTSSRQGRESCRSKRRARTSSRNYPSWHIAGTGKNAYFRLTGTSMATAVVSGGVALLLDAESVHDPRAGEDRASDGRHVHAERRARRVRRRQREFSAVAKGRGDRSGRRRLLSTVGACLARRAARPSAIPAR